jgi:hypothetical protein
MRSDSAIHVKWKFVPTAMNSVHAMIVMKMFVRRAAEPHYAMIVDGWCVRNVWATMSVSVSRDTKPTYVERIAVFLSISREN